MEYTTEQQKVIDTRKKNLLVSAAAGSGKTAVLVERIIQMVIDEKEPVDIDRLLIVTYTTAAAAEMRERIFNAIEKELLKHPESEHLQRQVALIHNAKITTIHSFCLEVIRNYFGEIDLDPGFRIADEGELKLLKKDIMQSLLEDAFEKKEEAFLHFVETYSKGNNDKSLEELIERVYQFTLSFPMPDSYLEECKKRIECTGEEAVLQSPHMVYLLDYVEKVLEGAEHSLDTALRITEKPDGPCLYADILLRDKETIRGLLAVCKDYEKLSEKINTVTFNALPKKGDSTISEAWKKAVQNIRNDVKECIKDIREKFFFDRFENIIENEHYAGDALAALYDLVAEFGCRLKEAKQEKNIIDFNDMEHFALKILIKNENGVLIPTKAAEDYKKHFTEVIVDEYQDSNLVQEYILNAVSGLDRGVYNRFMVGDVKQSIYRFRQARPELFMEKYEKYPKMKDSCEVIDLSKNFRSRREVLDYTNTVFSKIMTEDFGGITYNEAAALYYGATYYPKDGEYQGELLIIEKPDKEEEDNSKMREAKVIASRIKELVGTQLVFDTKTGISRYAAYKDIVILLRSNKGWDDVFKEALTAEGIPCYTESKSGYFDTVEIRMVVEFLKVIDNPVQDIPLYGVMTSVFGGFSEEEMAIVKGKGLCIEENKSLFETVKWYAAHYEDSLSDRIKEFWNMIDEYRLKARFMPIRELLWHLFLRFDYVASVSAMKGGEQRRANVELLLQKASAYQKTSYFGAFHFVRYLEQIMEKEVDYGEADILDENSNVVRIMSIHKSKGLEFPVCFVAGLGKKINFMDLSKTVVLDADLGVGTDCIHYEKRLQSKTLSKNAIVQKMKNDTLAEEIRILYVAFTRAREKLIVSGTVANLEGKITSLMKYAKAGQGPLSVYELSDVSNVFEYVLMALSGSKGMKRIYDLYDLPMEAKGQVYEESADIDVRCIGGEMVSGLFFANEVKEAYERTVFEDSAALMFDKDSAEQLKTRLNHTYAHMELQNLYTKTTVSELKKAAFPDEEGAKPMFEEEKEKVTLPKFMRFEEKVKGTTRGTAFHKVMEVCPFEEFDGGKVITEELVQSMMYTQAESGKLPEEYIPLVGTKKIVNFLNSSLARRMINAAKCGRLYKEQPFVYGIDANVLNKEFPDTETVLIQGIIDAYFEEDGKLVLLDYKTDVIDTTEDLVKRYRTQLDYYALVLEKLLGKPMKDIVIYSFYLEKEIIL